MDGSTNINQPITYNPWLHRYIIVVVVVTSILIFAGGLVTTIGAGLAVPDWPLSFGSLNPAGWWKQNLVREEHGHRLIGAVVGLLTLIMAIWIAVKSSDKKFKYIGFVALIMVIVQGILGGLRVIYKDIDFAIVHACLGQVFFCTLITLMWFSSAKWINDSHNKGSADRHKLLATIVFITVFIQLMVAAKMRHSGAGLAIPTFPLVAGGLFPQQWDFAIAIHYTHRVIALIIFILILGQWIRSLGTPFDIVRILVNITFYLVIFQIFLGGAAVLTGKEGKGIFITTLHVLTGAFILALTFSTLLWVCRDKIAGTGKLE